jgi:hypothetical protein
MVEVLSQQQTIHCAKVGRKVSLIAKVSYYNEDMVSTSVAHLEGKLVGEQTTN